MAKMATRTKERWYSPGAKMNWSKSDTQSTRRRNALKSRKGNLLSTGRALMALSNISRDSETKTKARSDSLYFYAKYKVKK